MKAAKFDVADFKRILAENARAGHDAYYAAQKVEDDRIVKLIKRALKEFRDGEDAEDYL